VSEVCDHRFTIRHDPSGDESEADTKEAAILAARTMLEDNDWNGQCRIFEGDPDLGRVRDMVWADTDAQYQHLSTMWE
jgi:hypothetical protein